MLTKRTLVAALDDSPGVLNRIASLFRRRRYNIVSLSVGRTNKPGVSSMTVVVDGDEHMSRQLVANLKKLECVLDVEDITGRSSVVRDLALIKVAVESQRRMEIFQICDVYQARVVEITTDEMMIEMTGAPQEIRKLVAVLEPLGLKEMVHCGAVAMTYEAKKAEEGSSQAA